jgi:F-type H+-transporting ATPase subunit a
MSLGVSTAVCQNQNDQADDHAQTEHTDDHSACGFHHDPAPGSEYDSKANSFHHIADANVYSIGPLQMPLPVMAYAPGSGWDFFMSSKFHFETFGHGDGHNAYNRYVLHGGSLKRVADNAFPMGNVEIDGFKVKHEMKEGKEVSVSYLCYHGQEYKIENKSTADFGLFGGGITSFYDFSLTKNVVSMFIIFGLFFFVFRRITKSYKERDGMAPKGVQSFFEPIFLFIQDEVAKPFLGHKWEKFLPFLLSLFFFILGLNLWGQIPFFGGANVTGNLAVTMVLAIFTFIITNINGKKAYWEHVLWMPGVPAGIKAIILTPVEILGLFIKPFTLMLRLFANITAGHIVVLSFVGLIFLFGQMGASVGGALGGAVVSVPLTIFMMAIELLVAFIQAFVFTILAASYIGAAIEEHH